MSSKKIEKTAINKIENLIDEMECMDYHFNVDDTGISWDGEIDLYKGDIDKKDNFYDSISVQIKGRTTCNKKLQEKHKFAIDIRDLNNYLKKDGTLFLLVLFRNSEDFKIYYIDLLPYKLKKILKEIPNSKNEIIVKLKEVKDSSFFERIIRNFSIDRNEQKKISNSVFNQEKISINDRAINIMFYDWRTPGESILGLIGEEKYIYQYDENQNIVSINYIPIQEIQEQININISNKSNEIFYSSVNRSVTRENQKIIFGKAFSLDYINNKFNIKISGMLTERLSQLKFIKSLTDEKGFNINNNFLPIRTEEGYNNQFENLENAYVKMKGFLAKHKIEKDLNLDSWNAKDINDFLIWIYAIDEHKPIKIKEFEVSTIGSIKINDITFSIYASKRSDGGFDVYSIWDPQLYNKYEFTYVSDESTIKTRNFYSILNKEAYLSDDIKIEEMIQFFESYNLTKNEEILINFQVLELIKAYDMSRKDELLDYALYLLDIIKDIKVMSDIAFINKAQIVLRKDGHLSQETIEKLIKIRDRNADDIYKISTNLLIGNVPEAKIMFSKLKEKDKKAFMTYPISYFLIKENNEDS